MGSPCLDLLLLQKIFKHGSVSGFLLRICRKRMAPSLEPHRPAFLSLCLSATHLRQIPPLSRWLLLITASVVFPYPLFDAHWFWQMMMMNARNYISSILWAAGRASSGSRIDFDGAHHRFRIVTTID